MNIITLKKLFGMNPSSVKRSVVAFATVSPRLGHATALTVPRTVIHYHVAASLPHGKAELQYNFGFPWGKLSRSD